MYWSTHSRTGFEAALLRASRDLDRAVSHASDSGDENASNRIVDIQMQLAGLRQKSIDHARIPPLVEQIRGQTKIEA